MKILIIQHKMIGDVLTTSLLFELLATRYPNAQLDYLVNNNTLAVVKGNPFITKIWSYDAASDKDSVFEKQFLESTKGQGYDLVIDVYAKLRSAQRTKSLKPKQSVSYYKWYTKFAYKKTVKPLKDTKANEGLAIINRVLLLEALGIAVAAIPKPKIYLSQEEFAAAKGLIASHNIDKSKPLFMIGVLGSSDNKTYPLPYLALVLDHLVLKTNANLLLNYIPSQKPLINTLISLCKPETGARIHANLYGAGLREFLALTSQCDALIGNEGGAINMAKALNVPTFSIFSPWILKSAWNSYEQDNYNQSIHLADLDPNRYTKHPKKYKEQAAVMYNELTPEAVNDALERFITHHNFIA